MTTRILNFNQSVIILGRDLLSTNLIREQCARPSTVIVCTEAIAKLYGHPLLNSLQAASLDAHLITIPPGERAKTRETKALIEDEMLKRQLTQETTLIALGGGVTTDLAGFVAATYCRGIPLVSVPTSLLAMVDASIGGKTGVNTTYGKNLIGAFYEPSCVVIDFDVLKTLPQNEKLQGFAEMIKAGLIYDQELFNQIQTYLTTSQKDEKLLEELIARSVEIKLEVVNQDFREQKGIRRILNFGHTVAHALERFFDYKVAHGQAVAMGMIAEGFMACEMGLLPRVDFHQMVELLLPFYDPANFKTSEVISHMSYDKKSEGKKPRFVLLDRIGKVNECHGQYCEGVDPELIQSALQFLKEAKK